MNINLEHNFITRCHDIHELLNNVKKLSTFCNRLEKQAKLFPDRYNPDKYKGDGFELFAEALIKFSPIDNRIGINNYIPVLEADTGVDGYGIGVDLKPATVQVKYRRNSQNFLTANIDHLSNFTSSSFMRYGVNPNSSKNMLIITSAEGLHHYTDSEMFMNKVRCLGYQQLRGLVDNNLLFWDAFRKSIENVLNKKIWN